MDLKDLGNLIKKLRKEKKLTQEKLAQLSGYSNRSAIARIEKGDIDLPESKITALANALGVEPYYLMGWEKPEPKPIIEDPYDFGLLSEAERAELNLIINNNFALFMNTGKTLSDHDREEIKRILIKAYFENRE